jgi:hypothetical protein
VPRRTGSVPIVDYLPAVGAGVRRYWDALRSRQAERGQDKFKVHSVGGIRVWPVPAVAPQERAVEVAEAQARMNSYAERFVRTARAECTDQILIAGERHARVIMAQYIKHYNTGRSHQGHRLDLRAPDDAPDVIPFRAPPRKIRRRQLPDGLINEYQPAA